MTVTQERPLTYSKMRGLMSFFSGKFIKVDVLFTLRDVTLRFNVK